MSFRKFTVKPSRLIWRMSDESPKGEWVNPSLQAAPKKEASESKQEKNEVFMRSSFDLLNGVDVDDRADTVPDDLFDELFGPPSSDGSKHGGR